MFYTYINSIGQNLAINLFVYNNASSMLGTFSLIVPVLPLRTFAGHSLFEQGSFLWCLHHLACRFTWMWPKEWLPSSERYINKCLASFPLGWSFWSILESERLDRFSRACLAPLPLWWNVYFLIGIFFTVEFWKFFTYSRCKSHVRYVVYEYLLILLTDSLLRKSF